MADWRILASANRSSCPGKRPAEDHSRVGFVIAKRRMEMESERTVNVTAEYLNALRKAVGLYIDPETAIVDWVYGETLDPYGDDPNLPAEFRCVGREYFARSPNNDVWVSF